MELARPPALRRIVVRAGATALALVVAAVAVVLVTHHGSPPAPTGDNVPLVWHHGPPGAKTWTPWPQALHDAQHTDAATIPGPRTGTVRWTRHLEDSVSPGPVVTADGTIVVATSSGILHGLDPATGADRWRVVGSGAPGSDESTSAAVLPDGLILWPGPGGTLFAVSPTGHVRWRIHSQSGAAFTSPAVTASGRVVVGDGGGGLTMLMPDARGPHVRWRVALAGSSFGSAVWSQDGRTAYQSLTTGVVAVRDGKLLWRSKPLTQIIEVSPAVAPDGTIVIGTDDPYEYGLDPHDGSVLWRHLRGYWTYSSPGVTHDGIAYFGDHHDTLTGLDVTNGRVVFSFQGPLTDDNPGGIGVWTSVLVDSRHTVYAGTRQGFVYAVDSRAHLLWSISTGATVESYPALTGDGDLVIGTDDGRVIDIG